MKKLSKSHSVSSTLQLVRTSSRGKTRMPFWQPNRSHGMDLPDEIPSSALALISLNIKRKSKKSAFDNNVPITELRGNTVVRVFKSGKIEVVEEFTPIPTIEIPETFSIKP